MQVNNKSLITPLAVIIPLLFADQLLKVVVKTHMFLGQEIPVFGDWFILHFIENEGMAFGMKWGGSSGKILLSVFRILAAIAIGYYIYLQVRKSANKFKIITLSLIFTGALGNIIDSCFYGIIFTESTFYQVATAFSSQGGYAPFLYGKVVDMFYFPLIETRLPDWLPLWGGEHFIFFRPVFNLADASISTGVLLMLVFQKRFFPKNEHS
jgi:signal peptidase II